MDKEKLSSKKEYEKALKTAANILNLKVTIVKDRSGEVTYYTMRKKNLRERLREWNCARKGEWMS